MKTPQTYQTGQAAQRKLSLLGTSLVALATLMACAPLQSHNGYETSYKTHAKVQTQPQIQAKQTAVNRYGFTHSNASPRFNGHELNNYNNNHLTKVAANSVQKFASAEDIRLSPYVPPSQNNHRFVPQNVVTSNRAVPNLRPRFEHHLNNAPAVIQAQPAPVQAAPEHQFETGRTHAQQTPNTLRSQGFHSSALNTSPFAGSNSNIQPFKAPNKTPNIGQFETGKLRITDIPIPPLPDVQKQVIRQEQAALVGIQNKAVLAGSSSLRKSLDSAFARSSRLAAESLRVDEAEEVLKQAKARSKPRFEFRSSVGARQSETTFAFSNTTVSATNFRRSAELDLSLPIYQGGRLRAQRSSARLGIETARAAVSQTRGQIIEQTALAYLDVVRDRKLVALYQQNVGLLREQQSSVAELLAVKESTISEKALVDARLATQRIRLESGLGVLRESEARYRNLVGAAAPNNLPVPTFNLPLSLTEVQALAQQNNPEIAALISRAKSAEFDVDIAKSGNKPSLALQGVLRGAEGQSETIDRNAAAELLLNLRVPLSSGGEGKSRVRQAKIVRNRLNLEIRDTQDTLRDQVDRLWARKTASEQSQGFNATQIAATEFAVNTVAEQRAEGVATILDLLNVQQTLLDAQVQTVEAENRQDSANVQLLNLMGVYQ